MNVVIVGDMELDTQAYRQLVLKIVDDLKSKYRDLVIVSAACDKGIGHFVRERCLGKKESPDVAFVEINIHVWVRLAKARLAQVYVSRNATLVELGDEFHIITHGEKVNHISDLAQRVRDKGLPLSLYMPDQSEQSGIRKLVYNAIATRGTNLGSQGTVSSSDLKSQLE